MNRNKSSIGKSILSIGALAVIFFAGWALAANIWSPELVYQHESTSTPAAVAIAQETTTETTEPEVAEEETPITLPAVEGNTDHIKTPATVKAVYMSQCLVGAPGLRASLVDFIEKSELNAVVIDIKDSTGGIAFPTDDPLLSPYVSTNCGAYDMKEFVASLHKKGIYVIGRITVFQDPTYARAHPSSAVQSVHGGMWKNYGGLAFVDVGSKLFWDYIIRLSEISYRQIGFDELNYDYIRFPSDGPLKEAVYTHSKDKTKVAALEAFFEYLHTKVQPEGSVVGENAPVISADLFGMASSHYDDLGIGQVLENALPYFDYIAPMVYVSHYPKGFNGYERVNDHVYDIVYSEMKKASARAKAAGFAETKIRPWLQSFDYPVAYTPAKIEEQLKALHDAGLESYVFWDAANKYTSLREVLQR